MSQVRIVTSNFEDDFDFFIAKKEMICNSELASQSSRIHWHDNFELEFICSGEGAVLINNKEYRIRRGFAYLITPSDLHSFHMENADISLYSLRFNSNILTDNLFQQLLCTHAPFVLNFSEERAAFFCELFEKILDEYKSRRPHRKELIRILFGELVIHFLRQVSASKSDAPADTQKNTSMLVHRICAYIKYNFNTEDLSVNSLAKHFYLSPNYLGTLFKKETGVSCTTYIKDHRLQFGRSLILSTSLSVSDVADKCGFASSAYFTKEFRKRYGVSPFQLRQDLKNKRNEIPNAIEATDPSEEA